MTDSKKPDSKTVTEHRALQNQGSTTPDRYPAEKTRQYRELTTLPTDRKDETGD